MELRGRHLQIGLSGPDIADLHRDLMALGYQISDSERSVSVFGTATGRAVAAFQQAQGMLGTEIVDAGTAAALSRAVAAMSAETVTYGQPTVALGQPTAMTAASTGAVSTAGASLAAASAAGTIELAIRVVTDSGRPVSRAAITIRDAGRGATRTLAQGITDLRGVLRLAYDSGATKTRVVVEVDGRELARSPVLFTADSHDAVELVVRDDLYQGPSEFERVGEAITRVLGSAALADLTADDIEELAREADVVPTHAAWYIQASRLARFGIPAETFYALLRDRLPAGLPAILSKGPRRAERALRRAYAERIVPAPRGGEDTAVGEAITQLESLAAQGLLFSGTEGDVRLKHALEASGVPESTRLSFAKAWVAHRGNGRTFWAGLRTTGAIPAAHIDALEFTLRAAALAGHHPPAVRGLAGLKHSGAVRSIRDLATWDLARWNQFVRETGTPDQVPAERYAETLERVVEDMVPTAFLANRLQRSAPRGAEGVADFLDRNRDVDIIRTVVAKYVELHPQSLHGIADAARVVEGVKRVQRVYNLTPRMARSSVTAALLERGIESAAQVVHMGADGFVDTHAPALEGLHPRLSGRQLAATVFERASRRNGFSVAMMSQLGTAFNTVPLLGLALPTLDNDGPGMATLRDLFGSLDYCACEHCRSVFGPAAYLVDLLAFLQSRPAIAAGTTALQVLQARRPDLTGIELSCANTNTVMPYIDLVLEVLEQAVLHPGTGPAARQTAWSEAELRIAAEHHDPNAYNAVAAAAFPWTLPFALSAERMRAYLRQLGVPRHEAMRAFAFDTPAGSPDLVAESLAMGRNEMQIVSGTTAYDDIPAVETRDAWGMTGAGNWVQVLANDITRTLENSHLSYEDLLSLLTLDFINPSGAQPIAVRFDQPSCDLADAHLENLSEAALDRLHRFVRLWRNRNLPMNELDRLIRVLGAGQLNFGFLQALVSAIRAAERLRSPVNELLVLWQPLDTRNYGEELSPYHRLFQNRQVTREPDPAFAAHSGSSEIDIPVPLTGEHLPTLRAASRLSAEELELLIASVLGDTPQLDLASISQVIRHARLAAALRMRASDLVRMRDLTGIDPFADPESTLAFTDEVERIRSTKVTLETLDYALRHRFHPDSGLQLTPEEVDALLATIVDAARRIDEALSAVTGEPAGVTAAHLAAVFPDPAVVREWIRLLGLDDANLTDADRDFLTTNLAAFAEDPDEAAQELAALSGEARYEFIAQALEAYLRRTGRLEALVSILAAHTGLSADKVRALIEDVLHIAGTALRAILLDDTFLAQGQIGPAQREAVLLLRKAALVVGGLGVAAEDLSWYFTSPAQPQSMDLNALPQNEIAGGEEHYAGWRRVSLGMALREHVGSAGNAFAQAAQAASAQAAATVLAEHTSWAAETVTFAIGPGLLGITLPGEVGQLADPFAVQRIAVIADMVRRTGVDAATLAGWARDIPTPPASDAALRALRARYSDDTWPEVITPIADRMRERQRDALLDFLIATTGFRDSIEVYAHYLIDPEMAACMLTSRIRLAISAVQLYVQRVLMNLEQEEVTLPLEAAQRWKTIKLYRLWEADRRVFFYPENWVEPQLRDDKTPFFQELEQHLNQGEIDDAHVEDGYRAYLRRLHEVGHLETVGVFRELEADASTPWHETVHVLSRTRALPHKYFYRNRIEDMEWSPWREVPIDIQGDQVTLVAYNRRLFLFWLELAIEAPPAPRQSAGSMDEAVSKTPKSTKHHHVRVGWTELRDGRWGPKRLTEKSEAFLAASAELARQRFAIVAWRAESDPAMLHVDAMVRLYVPHKKTLGVAWNPGPAQVDKFATFAGYLYDDCRDELVEKESEKLAHFTDGDMGMGLGVEPSAQFHVQRPNDTHLDVLTYHPEQTDPWFQANDDIGGYRQTDLLAKLPLDYRVTVARQRRLYLGDTPLVFDDEDRAFYIVPVYELDWIDAEGITPDPSPTGAGSLTAPVAPGQTDWWANFALMSPAEHNALVAAEQHIPASPALVAGPAPWAGRTPGLTSDDPQIAVRSLERATAAVNASLAVELPHASDDAPAGGIWIVERKWRIDPFHHPYTCALVALLNRYGVEALFTRTGRQLDFTTIVNHDPGAAPGRPYRPTSKVALPNTLDDYDFIYGSAYGVYNWELFFHAPMLIAERLRREGRYAEAQRWYHFIFDPTRGVDGEDDGPERFWNIKPLYKDAKEPLDVIKSIFSDDGLKTSPEIIDSFLKSIVQWIRHPFSPHAIARVRIGTYNKVVVRKYLDNLIDWADSLFRQDTIESINEATQLYLLAATMLGAKPRRLAEIDPPVRTYDELALPILFGGLTELEGFYPAQLPDGAEGPYEAGTPPTPPVWWYFCLPPNDKLLQYWDTVADRLFKIRHCQNIAGVERQLRLFEPPIDPALLVKAAASGVDIGAAIADLHAARPHYRYAAMVGRAIDLANDVRALGGELLSALEKRDAEGLALLRSEHEIALLNAVRDVRVDQVRESETTIEMLQAQKEIVAARGTFYLGREKISPLEKASMALDIIAAVHEVVGGSMKALGGALALIPEIDTGTLAIIPMLKAIWGGKNLSAGVGFTGDMILTVGGTIRQAARTTGTLAEYTRKYEDWQFQGKQAEQELDQIDKQITGAQIRLAIAQTELRNHDQQVEQARRADEYLRTKFTNAELYDWMAGQVSAVFFQSYKLAYDTAKKAERAMQFELGREDLSFVEFGYWDSLKRGLMSGELLHHSLKRMDAAYLDHHARELELSKRVSLRRIDPAALVTLHETGSCTFTLDEILFDLDHPGHYFRRIKSVSLSLNATVDDHTSPGAKLSLISDHLRINTQLLPEYPRDAEAPHEDTRFRDGLGGIQSIATSRGRDDAGLFELSFQDQRYLPFEGAGAVSRWRLELPEIAQYDYRSISDVEIQVHYTARDGGAAFRAAAAGWVEEKIAEVIDAANETGLVLLLSAQKNFATAWERFLRPAEGQAGAPLPIPLIAAQFPFVARSRSIEIDAVELVLITRDTGAVVSGQTTLDGNAVTLAPDGLLVRGSVQLPAAVALDAETPPWNLAGVTVSDPEAVDDLVVLARYHIVVN